MENFSVILKNINIKPLLCELFGYSELQLDDLNDYLLEIEKSNDNLEIKKSRETKWIYSGDLFTPYFIGLLNDRVMAINQDAECFIYCNHFQDIPFESYRQFFYRMESEKKEHLEKLKEYKQWLKDNNIPIDPDCIYHDENGELFDEYFEHYYE